MPFISLFLSSSVLQSSIVFLTLFFFGLSSSSSSATCSTFLHQRHTLLVYASASFFWSKIEKSVGEGIEKIDQSFSFAPLSSRAFNSLLSNCKYGDPNEQKEEDPSKLQKELKFLRLSISSRVGSFKQPYKST